MNTFEVTIRATITKTYEVEAKARQLANPIKARIIPAGLLPVLLLTQTVSTPFLLLAHFLCLRMFFL